MKLVSKRLCVFIVYGISLFLVVYIPFTNETLTQTQLLKEFWFVYLLVMIATSLATQIDISK